MDVALLSKVKGNDRLRSIGDHNMINNPQINYPGDTVLGWSLRQLLAYESADRIKLIDVIFDH